ncbi:dienelactone hydrolase family protein [Sphingomonas sp.]|uniref:dienelactone hydrolase family protein n=1 Tax=Sphingomonas sp. TaxID=28214 RepID=UPI001B18FA17|nr:dienelactone hydrolase family protein [Sphingomonas sp.]MBO9711997.1 dienelactone hydrolase family protein [Sphingomonas sp.]
MADYVTIEVPGGAFQAYVARPAIEPAPAVVVVQEIFGINDDIKETCAELASRGFIAVAPDLFWRLEPGVSLSHWSEEEWKKGLDLYGRFDFDQGVRDVAATIDHARAIAGGNGKAGVMGYCLGGLMTFLVSARFHADAAVEYYGGGTEGYAGEAKDIGNPLIIHVGTADEYIGPEAQATIEAAVASNPNVTFYSYPGCSHAFARHTGTKYDAEAAALANGRTWDFLETHLR